MKEEEWPPDLVTNASPESMAEAKATREIFAGAIATTSTDDLDALLDKSSYWKSIRVCAWIRRFSFNFRTKSTSRATGPLTTQELNLVKLLWEKKVQERAREDEHYQEDRLQLNLQPNPDGVLECSSRIQGHYPVYLPDSQPYTKKLVEHAHLSTLHGGVGLTMAKIREHYWVPRLRKLAKRITRACHGFRRFQAQGYSNPPPGNLPRERTEGETPFQVIGVDYAGPLKYRDKAKMEGKAFVSLYTCSLTRVLHLDLLPSLETKEFLRSFKRFIARRGRPETVYSDNGKSFLSAAKWISKVMSDEKIHDFLANQQIKWKFDLSRAPWWGGQFERMVGLVKAALSKTVGNSFLTWAEFEEILLDVEVTLNNRPLSCADDDVQLPLLTPNSLMYAQPNTLPELEPHHIEDRDLRKRAKYLKRCKDALWCRWTSEYLRGLRDKHRLKHKHGHIHPFRRDVVIIESEEKNRGLWKLGIIEEVITGQDGVVRGAKLTAGKSIMEGPVQLLYPLELSSERLPGRPNVDLDPTVPAFRPRRHAAAVARVRIRDLTQDEHQQQ